MTKANRKIEWTLSDGRTATASITAISGVAQPVAGHERADQTIYITITAGDQIVVKNNISGFRVLDYHDLKTAPVGMYAVCDVVCIYRDVFEKFEEAKKEAIAESEDDDYKNFVEQKKQEKKQERTSAAIENAKRIIEAAKKEMETFGTTRLLTQKQYIVWRRDYNNAVNEGGEGYIPPRVMEEEYQAAQEIVNQN